MKRNAIYLIDNLSDYELDLLKRDFIDYSIYVASRIKNLKLSKEKVEEIIKLAIERVFVTYKFRGGNSLGESIQKQVIVDLRLEFEKTSPTMVSKVIWPDLDKRGAFDKLLEVLEKVKLQPRAKLEEIFWKVKEGINLRQQDMLSTIYNNPNITYIEISKQFGKRGVMTYKQIKIIYNQLLHVLEFLEIKL